VTHAALKWWTGSKQMLCWSQRTKTIAPSPCRITETLAFSMQWCNVWLTLCRWDSWCLIKIMKSSVHARRVAISARMRSFSKKCGNKNGQILTQSSNRCPKCGGRTLWVSSGTHTSSLQFTLNKF
jgi:hypothetical protein